MLTSFRQVSLDELTKEDLDNLAVVVNLDPEMEPQFVYNKLACGEMLPWKLETPKGNTLITVEIKQKKHERTLYVWTAGGTGLIGNAKYITETLVEFAKLNNCTALEALTTPAFAKYMGRVDFKIKHVFVKKELD